MMRSMDDALEMYLGILYGASLFTPLWLPVVFAAFAIGRRRFSLRALLVFVTLESVSIGAVWWALQSDSLWVVPVY